MIDREKIIRGLQIERECVSRDCDRDCGKCDLVQDRDWLLSVYDGALELLKEQETVEPIPPTDESDLWKCGNCNHQLFRCTHQRYCEMCGREVKWDARQRGSYQ